MATLPVKVAPTTFSTGKTNRSKVVDVYANTDQAGNLAQNEITSVLSDVGNKLLGNVEKILGNDKFVKNLSDTAKGFLSGDATSIDKARAMLKEYKGGGLSGMLETNTIKELKNFGDNIVKNVEGNVKELAFGSVKGFVDKIVPGVLDNLGVTSFTEAKLFYDSMVDDIQDLSGDVTRIFGDGDDDARQAAALNTLVLDTSIEVINSILDPSQPITIRSTNLEIDNAIISSSSISLIEEDNETINAKIFDAIENDEVRELYISSVAFNAADLGAINFLILCADKSSDSFVQANLYSTLPTFLKKVKVPKLTTDVERTAYEVKLIRIISIFKGRPINQLTVDCFEKLPTAIYDILKFNTLYADMVCLANTVEDTNMALVYNNSFPELTV